MIYIDKCRTDLGVTVDEWAVDDRCRFSDSGKAALTMSAGSPAGRCCLMNKELLEPIMRAHGDKNKDLAAAIGMSVPNFSTIWNGRGEFALKYIRLIARRYSLTPEQVYKIFIFPQG